MDGFDIFLYAAYFLTLIAVAASLLMPLINSIGNPKSLLQTAVGIGILLVLFGVSYALSGDEVTDVYRNFNVDASGSKTIGGMLTMMYLLIGIAVFGILFTEVNKMLK